MKPFSTEVARIRPGVTVDEEVGGESAAPLECFPALRTLKHKIKYSKIKNKQFGGGCLTKFASAAAAAGGQVTAGD